mgnify:CR=1 FL=1
MTTTSGDGDISAAADCGGAFCSFRIPPEAVVSRVDDPFPLGGAAAMVCFVGAVAGMASGWIAAAVTVFSGAGVGMGCSFFSSAAFDSSIAGRVTGAGIPLESFCSGVSGAYSLIPVTAT